MEWERLLALAAFAFASTWTPGPNNIMLANSGATFGYRASQPHAFGVALGFPIMLFLIALGLGELFKASPVFRETLKWAGAALLLYLAWRIWTALPVPMSRTAPEGAGLRLLGLGTLLPLGNPKAIGFYIAILPTVVDVSALSAAAILSVAAIIVVVWTGTLAGYAAIADRASRVIQTPRAQRWLNRGSAGAMIGAAGTIASR